MKTKLLIPTVFFFLTVALNQTVAQTWQWANSAGGTADDQGTSTVVDASGNVYVTGFFMSASITFGSTTLTNANSSGTTYDIFLVKYDNSGNVLWAKNAGGTSDDKSRSVAVDGSGNVFITGSFLSSSITFGSATVNNLGGSNDIFIVKYDGSGNVLWAKGAGGNGNDYCNNIKTDGSGNSYITGYFNSTSITFGSTTLTYGTGYNNFLVKYNSAGTVVWAKSSGGTADMGAWGLAVDNSGNSYSAGYFSGGSATFASFTLTNAGSWDIYVVKYDALGNVAWAKGAGGSSSEYGQSIAVDGSGNTYLTGGFNSTSLTFGSTTLTNAGSTDIFTVKYDGYGNVLWAKSIGGNYSDVGYGIVVDGSGNSYLTGYFQSSSITVGSYTLTNTNATTSDIIIAKYDASGNVLQANSVGGAADDVGYGIAVNNSGNYVAGYFKSTNISFGSFNLTNADNSGNTGDIFAAKLSMTTGINENNFTVGFLNIFPNPFSTQTTFQTDNAFHNATLTVDNCFGQTVVQTKNISGQTITFNRVNLPSGLYFVHLTQDSKVIATKKLIITD